MKTKRLLGLLLFITQSSFSYPVFYGCEDQKLVSSEAFDETDLFKKLLRLEKEEQLGIIRNWCGGAESCMKDLRSIITFAGTNHEIALKQFSQKLKEYNSGPSGIKAVQGFDPVAHKKLVQAYQTIKACEDTKGELKSSDFVTKGKLKVFYPYSNNYLFITGCAAGSHGNCSPMLSADADNIIKESLIMGTDPYTAISIAVMEGGTSNLNRLYLDPIGLIDSLGCSGKQVANGSSDSFTSYGTAYKIEADTKSDPKVSEQLKKYFQAFKYPTSEGKSYYCYGTKGSGSPGVSDNPVPDSCCFDLGFKIQSSQQRNLERALVFHFINKTTQKPFRDKTDPSWRLQRFNGYTDLMGGAEGVQSWRAGVNYYKDPAYGIQSMDYIVNSLITNPWLKDKIESYQKIYGTPESILCKGRENGSYYVDSDHYFNAHKNAPRLAGIKEKFGQGVHYSELTAREKKVLDDELGATSALNPSMKKNLLTIGQRDEMAGELYEKLEPTNGLLIYGIRSPEHVYKQVGDAAKTIPKEDFVKAINLMNEDADLTTKLNKEFSEIDAYAKKIKSILPDSESLTKLQNPYLPVATAEEQETLLTQIKDPKAKDQMNVLFKKHQEFSDLYSKKLSNVSVLKAKELLKDESLYLEVEKARAAMAPLDEQLKHHKEKLTPALAAKLKTYYLSTKASIRSPEEMEAAYKGYFTHVYLKRNTVSKASSYPWKKLDEAQVKRISGKLK